MLFLTEISRGSRFSVYAVGSENGCPYHEFLQKSQASLPEEWGKLASRIDRAAEHGPPKNEEQCRMLKGSGPEDTVFEFKTHKLRLFWFYDKGRVILCVNGLVKGTDKEQDQAIDVARRWKADYFKAKASRQIRILPQT